MTLIYWGYELSISLMQLFNPTAYQVSSSYVSLMPGRPAIVLLMLSIMCFYVL
jgi:hypothetical protein